MSDSRDQPIDQRMGPGNGMSLRDFIVMEVGGLKQAFERLHEDSRARGVKLDWLVDEARRVAIALEKAGGADILQDKVISDLAKIIGNEERGLIKQVADLEKAHADLEKAQARQKYTLRGMMLAASAIGSMIGGAVAAAGLFFGRGIR